MAGFDCRLLSGSFTSFHTAHNFVDLIALHYTHTHTHVYAFTPSSISEPSLFVHLWVRECMCVCVVACMFICFHAAINLTLAGMHAMHLYKIVVDLQFMRSGYSMYFYVFLCIWKWLSLAHLFLYRILTNDEDQLIPCNVILNIINLHIYIYFRMSPRPLA